MSQRAVDIGDRDKWPGRAGSRSPELPFGPPTVMPPIGRLEHGTTLIVLGRRHIREP